MQQRPTLRKISEAYFEIAKKTLAKDGQSEIAYHDVPETGDEAKKLFDTVRKHASMRAALEAI